jgi:hypothetical protein
LDIAPVKSPSVYRPFGLAQKPWGQEDGVIGNLTGSLGRVVVISGRGTAGGSERCGVSDRSSLVAQRLPTPFRARRWVLRPNHALRGKAHRRVPRIK